MNFVLGPKLLIINDPADALITYLLGSATGYVSSTAAAGSDISIEGYGKFKQSSLSGVRKVHSVPSAKQASTLTITTPGTLVVGQELIVKVILTSSNLEAEFQRWDTTYGREKYYQIIVKAGDTPTTIADRIDALIDADVADDHSFVTSDNTAGVVTITSGSAGVKFDIEVSGSAVDSGFIVGVDAVTVVGYEGRGLYANLKTLRLETNANSYPYPVAAATNQLPLASGTYTAFYFKASIARPDLSGGAVVNGVVSEAVDYLIFMHETNCSTEITNLTTFLSDAPGDMVNLVADTAVEALAQPEITTVVDAQTLTGAGAVNLTTLTTLLVTTGADALTLANGVEGQVKTITMLTDGGDGTLTPTTLADGDTITFNNVGDSVTLLFTGGTWIITSNTGAVVA